MKRLSYLFIALTLLSSLATGCGTKSSVVVQYPQQNLQQDGQAPVSYQQNLQSSGTPQKFIPDSPDVSNPVKNILPDNNTKTATNTKPQDTSTKTPVASADKIISHDGLSVLPDNGQSLQPSPQASAAPAETDSSVPWYKKVINKVKSIFS